MQPESNSGFVSCITSERCKKGSVGRTRLTRESLQIVCIGGSHGHVRESALEQKSECAQAQKRTTQRPNAVQQWHSDEDFWAT